MLMQNFGGQTKSIMAFLRVAYWSGFPRGIGILSKLRHFVTDDILTQLYYSLVYPLLAYGLAVWGNTYASDNFKTELLPCKSRLIITLSKRDAQSSPLFSQLGLIKFMDLFTHDCEDHSLLDLVTVRNK